MDIKLLSTKKALWILVTFCLTVALSVYATIDRTAYSIEKLVLIPDTVISDSWVGAENILTSDLDRYSLYQDFNTNNSAYLDFEALNTPSVVIPVSEDNQPTDNASSDTESAVSSTSTSINSEETDTPPETNTLEVLEEVTDSVEEVSETVEPESEPEPEPVPEPTPEPESQPEPAPAQEVSWGILPYAKSYFPLAQEVISEPLVDPAPVEEEVVEVIEPTPVEVETESEPASEPEPIVIESDSVDEQVTSDSNEEVIVVEETASEDAVDISDEEVLFEDLAEVAEEESGTDLSQDEADFTTEEEEVIPSVFDACTGDPECKVYSTTFTGFSLPEFESDSFLSSVQIRMSLAAQTRSSNFDGPQRFIVEYMYASDEEWRVATTIDIEDETSNSINGGYYLVSIEKPAQQNLVSTLQVRVSYQGNIDNLKRAYIESLWLEVDSASFYEETDAEFLKQGTDDVRDLEMPKFHELTDTGMDTFINKLPSFTLSYSPQTGFLSRVFNSVFGENQYQVESVRIISADGETINIPVDITYHDDKVWTLQFLKQPQKLVPGKYTVELVVDENETLYTDTFEFYWGVLAVNTTKSMYFPGEDITLNLAALTNKGDTICDARLELKIIDPDNNISEIPVEQSGFCGENNVTDVPDYLAEFSNTREVGKYTIQLAHFNRDGEVIHKIQDGFEVREYIPYDIERTAPTRIYPLAPYAVTLNIEANRVFEGEIIERVPRGFVIENAEGAEIRSLPEYTEIVWTGVSLQEGDDIQLSYTFDAPDISPYMYLLGPLNMDGFEELRKWQIASDALTAIASMIGNRTVAGVNINQTASPLEWSGANIDPFYYDHSTSTDSHIVTIRQAGDYFLSVNLPQERTDANSSRTRVGVEVRVNGVAIPDAVGRSGYIRNLTGHAESSSYVSLLLPNLSVDDEVVVFAEGLTTIDAGDIVNVSGQASLILEYIGVGAGVFSATTTETTNSTNLNQTTAFPLIWTETRQDTGFVHSDSINPEQIIISNPGVYYLSVNVPITNNIAQTNIRGEVLLDGVLVPGGVFAQGYAQNSGTESDGDSSIHWSGVIETTSINQIVTVTTLREARAGTVTVTSGLAGSIFIRELPAEDVIALRGTSLVGGTNWNPATAAAVQWVTEVEKDSLVFTHSISTNSHQITIDEDGDYYISYNDALNGALGRGNTKVRVLKNGTPISGAETKSHYIRNQQGHTESSGALSMMLEGLLIGDIISITTEQEAAGGTLNDTTDAVLLLWKKASLNFRPDSPVTAAPFDNIRFASTTPYFEFTANDPDGTSDIEYEFSIATSTGFAASTTFNSSVVSDFFNTASSTDTSPFVEGNAIRFQLPPGDDLSDGVTYYWRVRARDVTGSGEFSDWSTTKSLTVDLAVAAPSWYQSFNGQFEGNTLIGTVSSGEDRIQVDATVSGEMLMAYGEGTVTTPRYRVWNGASWGVEQSALAVSGTINWLRTSAGVSRDEYAMITLDAANDSFAQVYSASTSSWGNQVLLSSEVNNAAYRGIALAYESVSGDLMAVSCTNSPNPVYRIWNGTSWSATSTITVSSLNNCNFLEIASDPASDEIILIVRDTGTQYEALVWDGSAWVESRVIGSSAKLAREGMAVAYETSGEQAVILTSNGINNNFIYTTWNGVEFSTNATQALGNDLEFGRIATDPNSDQMALCYIDEDNDIGVVRWNGGVWATFLELDTGGNVDTGRPVECAFETAPGRSDYLMAVYSDTVNVRYREATSTVWSTEATVDTIQDSFWVRNVRAGDGTLMQINLDDVADNLEISTWNGSSWSTKEILETNLSSVIATPYEMFDISPKRFQFSEGVAITPPITFTDVPNQPTWGDVSFDTVEPFGTEVKVRLRYTSVTTCDTLVPDIGLAGNSTGFDVTQSPIDLVSLSTTTYSQICLEATLTTQGSESAALSEWTLAWLRQPKLTQSNYRWYVNGSFLTPTDPWPAGVEDVAENTSIDSSIAINVNETVRLRMSLQGSNVDLPAFSEAFKLQYAEGFTCSNSLTWSDVGGPASSTAVWRGYENSIVGSDWYNGSWGRRIKITVPDTVVADSVVDFPVYVDLSDLPSGFFNNVQSDGDDIRVTEVDGVTELPFELVSIDTGLETGELHFKADLSSTTDSEFFVYYSNPSASGYGVGATYGARNVWTNGFSLRYAMDDSPVAASPQFKDSTSNNNSAVAYAGMTSGDVVPGQIGDGIDLDGNDGATFQTALAYAGTFTASMWWNASGDGFAIAGPTGAFEKVGPWSSPAGRLFARTITSSDTTVTHPTDGTWTHMVLTRDASNKVDVYFNGTRTRLYGDAAQAGVSDWVNFGGETSQGFRGILDELRFANLQRSSGWISTEFNNQSNPTGFYSLSPEELISDGRLLPTLLLSESDYAETYEEESPTRENQNLLVVGNDAEWDFVLQNNNSIADTNYCFRMVYEDGSLLNQYQNYPRLITNAPPLTPTLIAPFDNERLASTSPWFEFSTNDELEDEVAYEIQVSTDNTFGSTVISNNSISSFALFTNLQQPAQKSQFTSGDTIQFISPTALTNGNTYWWRVRAQDPDGSGTYGNWSDPESFTVNTATVITTWFQTTGEQFANNSLLDAIANANDAGIDSGFTVGTTTSTVIDYDDRDSGNAWGDFTFTNNVTSGSIRYYIEYRVSGETFELIPDVDLAGNSSGFTTSVSLVNLSTVTYNEIRIVAVLSGNSTLPRLQDWTVTWSETIEPPELVTPFDNAKVSTTTPSFTFVTADPEGQDLQYELQISADLDFVSSSTFVSGVDAGFSNTQDGADTNPFTTNQIIRYLTQSPLTNGNTYWWRVRARDPGGSNNWSEYSTPSSITIDTSVTTSVWFQTTGDQFSTNQLVDIETTAGAAQITSVITEVMTVYGEGTGQSPQYRLWNGTTWGLPFSALSVGAQIRWLELKAAPSRPEYALATLGTDNDVNFQIYDVETDTWGNVIELQDASVATNKRTFNLAYETNSGDLLALACDGTEAVYSIWNGSTWSATSTLTLSNPNDCEFIQVASDPNSDEIIAVFRHNNVSATDYEALVWNGSSWGNSIELGNLDGVAHEGMAVAYEESGGQAVVVVSNNPTVNALYTTWNGSTWSATTTHPLGDRIEWASLKADVGTDRLALCYVDNDTDIGVLIWDGSGWNTFTELNVGGNDVRGRSVDCEWQVGSNDGDLLVVYSDTIATRYQTYDGTAFSGELSLDIITDTFEDTIVRAGDGLMHIAAYDDALTPDRIDHSRFDGTTWTARERFTDNSSLNGVLPFVGGVSLASQIYPNFTSGSIRSTPIDFADGSGPRWDTVTWSDTTPGASVVEYRVYYESAPGVFSLIPDIDLSGNSSGFTTSPLDISAVDRTIYPILQIDAQLICDSGNCPTLQDWAVTWSEGITVSGIAREYDGVSTTTSGTVAVSVNGVLQPGKTGTILGDGTWSISNVTAFPDDTVLVFVDGAVDSDESVAVSTYSGVGNITGMELNKRHLTIGSASPATTTNALLIGYDNADDEDIFMSVDGSGNLNICVETGCQDAVLKIKSNSSYVPGASIITHDFANFGTFAPATNTVRVSGSWNGQGTFIENTSTVIFTATSTIETINATGTVYSFFNVTFGETSGTATWNLTKPLDVNGNLSINNGTLARGTSTFAIAGNLSIGVNGFVSGIATTTFDGAGNNTWGDAKSATTSSNIGNVVIDGATKTITLSGNVGAESVTIGSDDTLNASGSGFNINVNRTWTNSNTFIPQTGTVTFIGTTTNTISRGSSSFNNLAFTGVGGNWSFASSTLALNGSLTIATGTVTLPTGTTTIGASFLNTGGNFLHNNGEVRMTSNTAGRTISQSGTAFLNAFYDLVFAGTGAWSYSEANATTSRNFRIQSGTVTMPIGQLTVGGDFLVTGTGAFAHNNGEVILLVQDSDDVRTNGSSFSNLRTVSAASGSWYNDNWGNRLAITIQASQVDANLTNFPVYVNLDDLSSAFFSVVKADGGDIRVTNGDGVTEMPRELVSINTGTGVGELYFRADSVSSSTNSTFYIYYGNPAASNPAATATYGAQNVWSNGYVLTEHLGDLTTSSVLNSKGTPNGTKTSANNPLLTTGGKVYNAQDFSGDSIAHTDILGSQTNFSFSTWFKADNLTGSGDTATFGYSIFGISPSGSPYTWLTAGGTGNLTELRLCAWESNASACTSTVGAGLSTGNWYHVAVTGIKGGTTTVRVNGVERLSYTNAGTGDIGTNFTISDLRPTRNINFDGVIDEMRVANTLRSTAWQDAEYRNTATTTSFYTAGGPESSRARTFIDTNATILGNFILGDGGDAVFPTGILSIGGSFDNNAEFNSNSGTVRFNSTSGSETIAVGSSTFATLEFNSATGDFTVTENATATVAINLTSVQQFTLQSGRTLTALSGFNNTANGANTTWTGSTLRLLSGTTTNMNTKVHAGDVYGTLEAATSTLAKMWNSSADDYVTSGASSAIYSQDHAGVDGGLNIYGNYLRTTGTEFWSYATDFDGTALIASTSRQVDVRVATSSTVGLVNSSLNMVGLASASTTIDAISGAFALNATNTTITAEHFRVAGTGANGFGLLASSTLSVFRDGFFTVVPGRTGITFSTSTIDTNPSAQLFRIGFATTTAGSATNVTLVGTTTNFVWFREGAGNLYGEAFDGTDANPGSIRFDDSSNSILVSGIVYADDGLTPLGAPTCDNVTPNIRIVVDGGTYTASTTCASGTGTYSFPAVNYIGDPKVVVYLDTNGGVQGSVVTKTPTANITDMHIYANRVITRHQDVAPLSASDMQSYDFSDDSDLRFIAATTSLTLLPNTELFVFASTTFAPGGNITLQGNGNANGYEGTLQIGAGATFTATGTETHTLAGRFVMATSSNFNAASSTFIFNATTTGKSITAPNTVTFNQVQFNGVGGGWNITAPIVVLADMHVASGTVTGTSNLTLTNGSLYGDGVLSLGAGTTTLAQSNTFGGSSAWTMNNLVLGNSTVSGTTTPATTATTTILGRLTIANAHFLDAGNTIWDLAGTGTVFTETGTFLEDTSTILYSGAGANVISTNYYNLLISAGVGSATYTGVGSGILVLNDLTVGGGVNSTFTVNTTDQILEVRGDMSVATNGTFEASNSSLLTVQGDFNNDGVFNGNGGTVLFNGTGTSNIAAGNAVLNNVDINGTGSYVVTENATSTGNWSLIAHNNFTVNSGITLAIGGTFLNNIAGAATTFTGSNLFFYGTSTYEINDSATSDVYETLSIGANSQIRMWNSSASTYSIDSLGSLYSQDHAGVDGDLYVYGSVRRVSGDDYWSYDTDFDGSDLSGGSERTAQVYFASSSSAEWSGNSSLSVVGSSSATTTIQNQGVGTYGITIGGTASTEWDTVQVRDINSLGVVLTSNPIITNFSRTDHLVEIDNASAITVGGTVINANEAKNFTNNIFEAAFGVVGATNVTATGTSVSSWRFTNHTGNIAGEAFDTDPAGDPGYVVWDNSAALVTVAGNVYSDEGSTVSGVCDGTTNNIRLVVAGLTTYDTSCSAATGAYSIPSVAFSPLDTLTLYINDETPNAANVSVAPISSISNMHLYENRVIVRHENTNPITIADMAVWDSSDDVDIPFTAINAGTDTLTLPSDTKLIIWTGKTFEPNGNVTLSGGGAGADYDGTLQALAGATFRARTTEAHSVGGSVLFDAGATYTAASSTLTLTTTGAARTIDVNAANLHNLTFTGSGSWNVTDSTLTLGGSYTQSAGAVTLPTGTTTIGAAFSATGGSFINNGSPFLFTSAGAGNTVRFNNSVVRSLTFTGSGSWNMTDTNATSTGSVLVQSGGLTMPSGNFAVGGNFEKRGGTLAHNTSDLIMTATTSAILTASSSDLYAVRFAGPAAFTITDTNITFLDSFTIASGTVTVGTGTLAVGGSFDATGGTFVQASGTVLLNSSVGGRTINPGVSSFYNLQIGAPTGGYTMFSATTTNNFTISSANILTVNPGANIRVGGVFTNSVGGVATTWTGTTLSLLSGSAYSINTRSNAGDAYGTLVLGANTDIKVWYSSAATTTVATSSSLYSQDHANVNGNLYVYGDLQFATTTEYWNYAIDFDGTSLTGSERAVNVFMAENATTTITSGGLQILGSALNPTVIGNQATGTYAFLVEGGSINANYYQFNDQDISGLQLLGNSTVVNLSNGEYNLAVNTGSLITLASTTLNANPSKIFDNIGFIAGGPLSGFNINLVGETENAWNLTNSYGNIGGEGFDIDGLDACGSIRFDDSSCLLTEQTHFRWRADDGEEGAPDSEWYDQSFTYRTKVSILNNDNTTYSSSTAVKVVVPYDASMQSAFDDLRFTDSDGTTEIPYWVEKVTASTEAQVWVQVPSLPSSAHAYVFMYYGSSTAITLSDGDSTFKAFDSFEDNNISEYSGDTGLFAPATSPVFGGTYALKPTNTSGRSTDGIFRFDDPVARGEIIRYMHYVNTTGTTDEMCTLFAVQSPGTTNNNYAVCLELFGTDRISLAENVSDNDSSGTILASTTVSYTTGWYEVEIDWQTSGNMVVRLFNPSGAQVASISATDSSYTSGGYGFTYWFNNGAWDSFTSRNRVTTKPTVVLGVKQSAGGANWASLQDAAASAVPDDTLRLRVSIENSGLDITGQQYRLDYAPKGVAPTCESVSAGTYAAVPNQASCGSSPICMQTSTFVTNGEDTTDLLLNTFGIFSAGKVVTDPSNQASAIDIDQNYYTELEYALTATTNATDAYCFRVTNAGTPLDFYAKVPELSLQFDPTFGAVTLNSGSPISLTPGTTTAVTVSGTVSDFNGYTDLQNATATIYRSGAGASCTPDNNNCYVATTENGQCTFESCAGSSCELSCTVDIFFHADPTDASTFEGEEWIAYAEADDFSDGYDFASAPGVELITLRALSVDSTINYGSLAADSDTGSFNPTTTITNLGNVPINVDIEGTNLTDGMSSSIPAEAQKVATSTFNYAACVTCQQLSTSTPVVVGINLSKPSVPTPPVDTDVYWGISIPFSASNASHFGTNIFTPIGVD